MKRPLALALTAALMMSAAPAFAEDGPPPHDGPGGPGGRGAKMFQDADANKDGFLTKEEMTAAHEKRMDRMFTDLDTDKDAKLSKPELEAGRAKMKEKMKDRWKDHKDGEDRPEPPPEDGPKPE